MSTKPQHTPTPWRIPTYSGTTIESFGHGFVSALPLSEQGHENAKFIVRACNSHDDLLAACEFAARHIRSLEVPDAAALAVLEDVSAAIAKARGGAA